MLWNEYEAGIGVRKAENKFMPLERGQVKKNHSKRKLVWGLVSTIFLVGKLSNEVIENIYYVYEHVSVTEIITDIRTYIKITAFQYNSRVNVA